MLTYDAFDPIAYERSYDTVPRERYVRAHWRPRILARLARLAHDRQVLDVGCGYGHYLRELPHAKLAVGVDLSTRWVAHARREGLRVARADATALPFDDETFDLVFSVGVLEYVDRAAMLREARRVLRRGGDLVIVAPNRRGAFRACTRTIARLTGREEACDEPTLPELRSHLATLGLEERELVMDDALVWLPNRVDEVIGRQTYALADALLRAARIDVNPFSNSMLLHYRKPVTA